jgi:branched-chain amino acid transport system substrate-binding protein
LKGAEVRCGLENLNLTAQRLKELGMEGMLRPIHVSCADHESGGALRIQQWDGKQWTFVSDWIEPMKDVIGPLVQQSAAAYAKENNVTPRSCD